MAMRIATCAWFSLRARVPWGAPCIFGSIQQTRTAAYVPDTPYWSQGRLRPAILVGRQTPSGQKGMPCAAPEPKMTSISATLLSRSGTDRARGAECSVFCTARAGGTSGSGRTSQPFYAIRNGKHAKHLEIALLLSKLGARGSGASAPCAQIKQGGDAPNEPPLANKRGSSAIPK